MKRFICTDSLLMLPISGAFLALLGIVLIILYIVASGLTASLYYIEGAVPTYVAAVLLILTGAVMIILLKKRPNLMIFLAIVLSCVVFSVCVLQAISVGIVSIPFLGSFSVCVYHNSLSECQCYILSAKENNNTGIIVPQADSKKVTFQGVRSCAVIEHNMIDCLYILCIIYGFAGIASLVTGSLSFMLLCWQRRTTKEAHALQEAGLSRHRRALSDSETQQTDANRESRNQPNTQPSNPTPASNTVTSAAPGQRATIGHHDARNERPRIVQRSSSTSAVHGRPPATRNSVRDTQGETMRGPAVPQQPNQAQRQGRPPALVRGGYLQIHVNGPSIPVYILPGSSNEAFIALTDLPSLQLPSLDTVPAYVSEMTDLYPTDQPPPYSPTPDEHHAPTFSAIMESPSTPASVNIRVQPQTLALPEEDSNNQHNEELFHSENVTSVTGASVESPVASSVSVTPYTNTRATSSDQTGAFQTGSVPETPSQTDQSQMVQSALGTAPEQSSPSDPGQSVDSSTPVIAVDVAQSHEDSLENSPVSNTDSVTPRDEETLPAESSSATFPNSEIIPPGHSQNNPTRDGQAPLGSEERSLSTSQNISQGARPKYPQSRPYAGEDAYLAHTRHSSPRRSFSPPRKPSPLRGTSPNRRSISPSRRATSSAATSQNSRSSNREGSRARSNSRGRQRQLPDILPKRSDRLPDTEIRSSSNPTRQQAETVTSRAKPNQKKHHQPQSSQRREDQSPEQSSYREAAHKRRAKNPEKKQQQTGSRSKSREKASQHNADVKKDSSRKDHKHQSNSAKRKPGRAKIDMNIPPIPSSSSTESLTNILTLVESVHSSVKMKPKKHRQSGNQDKVNLVDSRV